MQEFDRLPTGMRDAEVQNLSNGEYEAEMSWPSRAVSAFS